MDELEKTNGAETPTGHAATVETTEQHHGTAEPETDPSPEIREPEPEDVDVDEPAEQPEPVTDPPSELYDESDVLVAEAVTQPSPMEDPHERIKAVIEAAIYITEEPLTTEQISTAIEQPVDVVRDILARLTAEYASPSRGLTIRELAGGYKMSTKAEHHEDIRKFVRNLQPAFRLSLAALETLAVIAYKQPITGPEIMDIRGVQGAGVLKTLLDRKLIATAGRKNVIGKPMLYKTTKEFLVQFGLSSLAELPTLKEFEELGRLALNDSEPVDEANSGTTGFADAAGGDAVIRPDLNEALAEVSNNEALAEGLDETDSPASEEPAKALCHEPVHGQPESHQETHAVEAEAQPEHNTPGSSETTEEAAQEVTHTHG